MGPCMVAKEGIGEVVNGESKVIFLENMSSSNLAVSISPIVNILSLRSGP